MSAGEGAVKNSQGGPGRVGEGDSLSEKMTREPRHVRSEGLSPVDIGAGVVQLCAIPEPNCPAWPLVTGCLVHLGLPWPPGKEPGRGPGTLQGPSTMRSQQ